jgi:uncharacterized membrane protein (UPF0127 family)
MPRHFLEPLFDADLGSLVLGVEGLPDPVAAVIETAFDGPSRTRGLLGRDGLPAGHALIIAPCWSIHTATMRFSLDVLFATRDGRILKIRRGLRPWRASGAIGAFAVIERPAGALARAPVAVGRRLVLSPSATESLETRAT